jgi:hypothetical protein
MGRGPGRIKRAIRAMFEANPDETITTGDRFLGHRKRVRG